MIGSRKVRLEFHVNWLLTICGAAVILIVAFVLQPTWRPILLFAAPVAGGAGALLAAFNALDSRVSQLSHAKRAVALDLIHRWTAPEFHHAKKNGREIMKHFRAHPKVEEQKAFLEADASRFANATDVLNLFETIAITVRLDMADEDMLKRFFRSIALEYWHVVGPLVKARRAEKTNSRLYQEYEWLFNEWSKS